MKQRPSSSRPYRAPSAVGAIAIAIATGAAAGIAAVLALTAARVSLVAADHVAASDQLALATPIACALAGGLVAVFLLHAAKVSDRDTLIAAAIAAAAPAFAFGHLARLFDPALALAAGGAGGRFSLAFWLDGCQWLEAARATEVVRDAPGLRPVSGAIGVEACAALAMCELLLVAGLLLAAVDRALDAPLCVACRRWCRRQEGAIRCAPEVPTATVLDRASARDWRFFRQLGAPRGRAAIRLDLAACPACDRMSTMTVSFSRPLRQDVTLVKDLRLGPDDLRTIRQMAAAVQAPPAQPWIQGSAARGAQATSASTRAQTVAG